MIVGLWPYERSMRRALRWDGVIPARREGEQLSVDDLREIRALVEEHREETTPFDIVFEGETPTDDPERGVARVAPLAEAVVTWWLESAWMRVLKPPQDLERLHLRIRAGPPRVE